MLTENRELMQKARTTLKGNWGIAIGATVVFVLISAIAGSPKYLKIIGLIISGPLTVGYYKMFLSLIRGQEVRFGQLFEGFNSFLNALGAYLLMLIFIILWSLLLIVPGIIAAFSYSLTYFIIADNPDIDAFAALKKSKAMMLGHKWKLFYLTCRFIWWFLLGIITLGIGFLWIGPYMLASFSLFYQDLLDNQAVAETPVEPVRTIPENGAAPDASV